MKIKVEIVDNELKSISNDYVKYIDVESYQHTKDFHTESVLEEMVDDILLDIKWDLAKPKKIKQSGGGIGKKQTFRERGAR